VRVYVHLPRHLDSEAYRARYHRGIEPDVTPYGFHHAQSIGFDTTLSRSANGGRRTLLERITRKLIYVDLGHVWRNRRAIAEADIVWTMLEHEALSVAMMMWLGFVPRRPIIGGTVWMVDRWNSLDVARRHLLQKLVSYWSLLLVHSEACLEPARRYFPNIPVELMYFGVSADTFLADLAAPPAQSPIVIAGVGNDTTRDWGTLLEAFGNDSRFRLVIVCSWIDPELRARYNNVEVRPISSMEEFRAVYREASYVAVPMKDNMYSGITVALEAVALGVPVLSSRTGGVPTYFGEDEMLFVPPGDPAAMRDAVLSQSETDRKAMAARARQLYIEHDYSSFGMMKRYAALTERILDNRKEKNS